MSVLLWAVMRGKNKMAGGAGREGSYANTLLAVLHVFFLLIHSSNIMAKSDPTNLSLRKWQWLPNA